MGKSLIIPNADFSANAIENINLFEYLLDIKQTKGVYDNKDVTSDNYQLFTNIKISDESRYYDTHLMIPPTNPISLNNFSEYTSLTLTAKDNTFNLFTTSGFADQVGLFNEGTSQEGLFIFTTEPQVISIQPNKFLLMFIRFKDDRIVDNYKLSELINYSFE